MISVRLDSNAQPPAPINAARRQDRAVHEMLGICKGIILDGIVTELEATYLHQWIHANPEVLADPVSARLAARLEKIFEDGRIDAAEREDLEELLDQLVGGRSSVMAAENLTTALPLDDPAPVLRFENEVYVLTGKFAFGPRHACEQAVVDLGGRCESAVTKKTSVMVIGSFGNRDWIHTSYGRKIQKAMQYRDAGVPLVIVSEDHWAASLP